MVEVIPTNRVKHKMAQPHFSVGDNRARSTGLSTYQLDFGVTGLQACHIGRKRYLAPSQAQVHTGKAAIEMLLTIDERGSKIARNSVFDCHLSPVGRQKAIENSVSKDFLIYVRR